MIGPDLSGLRTMPTPIKIVLFVALWFELTRYFALDADVSFFWAVCITQGVTIASALNFEFAGLEGELSALFVAWGIIWVALFLWLAPPLIKSFPFCFIVCAVVAIVYLGMLAFPEFLKRPELFQKHWLRERSEAVVGCAMGLLGACMISERLWGSLLPLVGYAALFVLPFAFGWRAAARMLTTPHEARFGQRQSFQDAGVSEDQ